MGIVLLHAVRNVCVVEAQVVLKLEAGSRGPLKLSFLWWSSLRPLLSAVLCTARAGHRAVYIDVNLHIVSAEDTVPYHSYLR